MSRECLGRDKWSPGHGHNFPVSYQGEERF